MNHVDTIHLTSPERHFAFVRDWCLRNTDQSNTLNMSKMCTKADELASKPL